MARFTIGAIYPETLEQKGALIIIVAVGNLMCPKWNMELRGFYPTPALSNRKTIKVKSHSFFICQFDGWTNDDWLAGDIALWLKKMGKIMAEWQKIERSGSNQKPSGGA